MNIKKCAYVCHRNSSECRTAWCQTYKLNTDSELRDLPMHLYKPIHVKVHMVITFKKNLWGKGEVDRVKGVKYVVTLKN